MSSTYEAISTWAVVATGVVTLYLAYDVWDRRRSQTRQKVEHGAAPGAEPNQAPDSTRAPGPDSSAVEPDVREESLKARSAAILGLIGLVLSAGNRKGVSGAIHSHLVIGLIWAAIGAVLGLWALIDIPPRRLKGLPFAVIGLVAGVGGLIIGLSGG